MLEKILVKTILRKNTCHYDDIQAVILKIGFANFRKKILWLAKLLPTTINMTLSDWVSAANSELAQVHFPLPQLTCNSDNPVMISDLFGDDIFIDSGNYRIGTVHSVKGETFDAVLLFLKQKGAGGAYYRTMLNNKIKTQSSEELRIAYVAMTRPRKLLTLAVPVSCYSVWQQFSQM